MTGPQVEKSLDVSLDLFELQPDSDILERLRCEAVHADTQFVDAAGEESARLGFVEERGVGDHLHSKAVLFGLSDAVADFLVQKRLAQVLQVDVGNSHLRAIPEDFEVKLVAHVTFGPLHDRIRAHRAAGIAHIRGFNVTYPRYIAWPNGLRKARLRLIR